MDVTFSAGYNDAPTPSYACSHTTLQSQPARDDLSIALQVFVVYLLLVHQQSYIHPIATNDSFGPANKELQAIPFRTATNFESSQVIEI
jgi:hypothetical protein